LVPLLQEVGHEVIALARKPDNGGSADVRVVVADALDRTALTSAVRSATPDAIINLLTALPKQVDPKRFEAQMALTNRLRTEVTANLIGGGGGARLICESLAHAYRPLSGGLADEGAPLWDDGPRPFRPVVRALIQLERMTAEAGGVVLRVGHLCGPGTIYAADGSFRDQVRLGQVPLVGPGPGSTFSFIHTHDAATAVLAALEKPVRGVFNIVDDEPSPISQWLPEMARAVGGPPPRRVPTLLARLSGGSWGVAFMTQLIGADNRRARRDLDWQPCYTSWRQAVVGPENGQFTERLGAGG